MPRTAAEIMDRNFFYATQGDSLLQVLHEMGDRGLSSAPLLDINGRPVGVATLRDIESCHDIEELAEHLTRSVVSLPLGTPIEVAARELAVRKAESLVLVDDAGVAVGALSALDVLRALLGINDLEGEGAGAAGYARELRWSRAELFELGAAHRAPEAPGVLLLSSGANTGAKRSLWAESTSNIRERLDQMLRNPQDDARLESMLEVYPRELYVRHLVVHDSGRRERLARALANMVRAASAPAGDEV